MTWNHQRNCWQKFMGELWKKWMTCGSKLIVKKCFLALIIKAKASILILPKFQPKICFFGLLMILSWLIGHPQINLQDCGSVRISTTHPFLNWQSKSNSEIKQLEFIKQVVSRWFKRWKNSFLGLCLHKKGHTVDILPYSQLCCLPYWFAEEHSRDMHNYITKPHFVKYVGLVTSAYAIDTILSCVIVFHRHHQSLHWRRILPRSNLYWWL